MLNFNHKDLLALFIGGVSGVGAYVIFILSFYDHGILDYLPGAFFGLFVALYAKFFGYGNKTLIAWILGSYLSFFSAINIYQNMYGKSDFFGILDEAMAGLVGSGILVILSILLTHKVYYN